MLSSPTTAVKRLLDSSRFLIGEIMQPIENMYTSALEEKGLKLYRGWSGELAQQLIVRSREPEIRKFTSRDATERFASEQAAEDWYRAKEHVVYVLFQGSDLAGVAWFTHTPKPGLGAEYTFAIRMYESQRGRGLAGALIESAHKDFISFKGYENSFWLESDESNTRAVHFYQKHGYRAVSTEGGRVLMVRKGGAS
jgi:ribosomal protein S18 acetylase RimI-like enzyme